MSFSAVITWIQSKSKFLKTRPLCLNVGFYYMALEWCNPRNGGKPVHESCHQMTQWPQPCATRVPVTSLKAHTCTWLMCCFLFAETISMASSNDTEGTLTPVDFIQLQHYMECKSRLFSCNLFIATFSLWKVNYENILLFIVLLKCEWMGFDTPVYRKWKAAELKIFCLTLRGSEPNEMVSGF